MLVELDRAENGPISHPFSSACLLMTPRGAWGPVRWEMHWALLWVQGDRSPKTQAHGGDTMQPWRQWAQTSLPFLFTSQSMFPESWVGGWRVGANSVFPSDRERPTVGDSRNLGQTGCPGARNSPPLCQLPDAAHRGTAPRGHLLPWLWQSQQQVHPGSSCRPSWGV